MERSSFFNSELIGEAYDRVYLAEDFARYFASFIGNGVFTDSASNLQAMAVNNTTIRIQAGKAWINGYFYENTEELILNLDVADGLLNRIDRIVLRLDFIRRDISIVVKKGIIASYPIPTDLERNNDIYELGIADININKGVINISQADITDLRPNKTYCGFVTGLIDQIDTTNIFTQFETAFNIWFEDIKGSLGEDAAGNLLNKINELKARVDDTDKALQEVNKEIEEHNHDSKYLRKDGGDITGAVNIRQSKTSMLVLEEGVPFIIGRPDKNSHKGSIDTANGLIKKWITLDMTVTRQGVHYSGDKFISKFNEIVIESNAFIVRNKTTGSTSEIKDFCIRVLPALDSVTVYAKYDGVPSEDTSTMVLEVRVAALGF